MNRLFSGIKPSDGKFGTLKANNSIVKNLVHGSYEESTITAYTPTNFVGLAAPNAVSLLNAPGLTPTGSTDPRLVKLPANVFVKTIKVHNGGTIITGPSPPQFNFGYDTSYNVAPSNVIQTHIATAINDGILYPALNGMLGYAGANVDSESFINVAVTAQSVTTGNMKVDITYVKIK